MCWAPCASCRPTASSSHFSTARPTIPNLSDIRSPIMAAWRSVMLTGTTGSRCRRSRVTSSNSDGFKQYVCASQEHAQDSKAVFASGAAGGGLPMPPAVETHAPAGTGRPSGHAQRRLPIRARPRFSGSEVKGQTHESQATFTESELEPRQRREGSITISTQEGRD